MIFGALGRKLSGLLLRRPVTLWHDPRYRLPLGGLEASIGIEPRRADFAAWWLTGTRSISTRCLRSPRRIAVHRLSRVHTPELLETLSRPEGLASVFGADAADLRVDELMDTFRLACGGTLGATRETLRTREPAINLLGGFHLGEALGYARVQAKGMLEPLGDERPHPRALLLVAQLDEPA